MRVLHVITGLGVGGAEQQLRLLLRHLPVHCEVVTLTEPGPVAAGIRADGTCVTHLGMAGNRDLAALPRLVRHIREGRYDVVHTHLYRACVYGRIAARLAGVRAVVATEHSLGDTQLEGRPLTRGVRALYLATERLGTHTVAVSDTVAHRLHHWGVPAPRVHVVPNGVDAAAFRFDPGARDALRARLGLAPDHLAVAGVGRLVAGKRFDALLDAVAAVDRAHLLLAGDGPERGALSARARAAGAADRVHLLGQCPGPGSPGVPQVLAAADVFVSASQEETFGLAVVEALAAGLPALYVTCPALEDLPAGAAPGARRVAPPAGALAAALAPLAAAPPLRRPVPAAVAHYDVARSARHLTALYRAAVTPPAVPAGPRAEVRTAPPPPRRAHRSASSRGAHR
ncbi:glycosyltransferase [Streptomyces sp. NPDC059740]|uniref:glycosyltransferase n=1 Tax=Streptomyces sp. NPDC059740 TaxID=3346926 RepID=UPI0036665D1D